MIASFSSQGCNASVLFDESIWNSDSSNRTFKAFDIIDTIKKELESACPGVVSCADALVLATRDGILLAGGPYYTLLTGRRDGEQSFPAASLVEFPRPNGSINETLCQFALRGFNARETVSLLVFWSNYEENLVNGRGLRVANQLLMADERAAKQLWECILNGEKLRVDFARAMRKMSSLGILAGTQGQIRLTCSMPLS